MTDLEDAWNDLPTGDAPVEQIIAEGRTRARRRRTRPLIAAGAVAALSGTFVAGAIVADTIGPGHDVTGRVATDVRPVAFQADLDPARNCDELLASYQDRGLESVSAWGWTGTLGYGPYATSLREDSARLAAPLTSLSQKLTEAQASSATGTNVQEPGVDEGDTVKTDGRLVVRLRGNDLQIYDVTGARPERTATLHLPRFGAGELLLSGSKVVAIGADTASSRDEATGMRRGTRVVTVSIDDPASPVVQSTSTYAGRVLATRQHDATIRLVLAASPPNLDFTQPGGKITPAEALRANRRAIEDTTIDDWLPRYDAGTGSEPLLDCTNVAVPPGSQGVDTVSIVGFTADRADPPSAVALVGSTTIAYASDDHVYLADALGDGCLVCRLDAPLPSVSRPTQTGTTHVYDFELRGVNAMHVASGEVEGSLADRWSIDEADDVLRLAVGPSSETGDFNSLVTLKRRGDELVEIGRVDGIGKNEQLKAVRWFDDLAVLVTFRETDPLYTIDLSDPARPKKLGKLKIPGFSDYLHPIGDGRLLGVGYTDGSQGTAQVSLFDADDLTDVKQTDTQVYRDAEVLAPVDPRAFTWLPRRHTALTVVRQGQNVSIAAITVDGSRLRSRLARVEYGDDAGQVRTIGLPDGRIVLVTGEDVAFFDL